MSSDTADPGLHLPERYLVIIQDILRRYLPHAEVWAYGSRVNGDHTDASDLDLVVRQPDDLTRPQPGLDEVAAAFSESDLPILVMSGSADPLAGGGQLVELLAQRYRDAGVSDVTVTVYADGRHEMLNELDRDQVTADVIAWLDAHAG